MANSKAATLRQAYADLAKADAVGDYDKALRTANRILKMNSNEKKAFQCKLVSLFRLENFEEVLTTIRKSQSAIVGDYSFEKAYAEYRLNKNDESLKTLTETGTDDDVRKKELLAQLCYRLNRFDESHKIYADLVKNHSDDFDAERCANLLAAETQLVVLGGVVGGGDTHVVTYEQHFNKACTLIARGKHDKALDLLTKAEKMCRQELTDDDVPEEEIEDELALIRSQIAYVMQISGKAANVADLYANILKSRPTDPLVNACANFNAFTSKADQPAFEAKKRIKACTSQTVAAKMTLYQKRVVESNEALMLVSRQCESQPKRSLRDRYKLKKEAKMATATPNQMTIVKRKRHRVRKDRLPKVMEPNAKLDPERWLPKQERSTYKRRKDKRSKMDRDVGRGTQGSSAANAEAAKALDASLRPTAIPQSPSTTHKPSPAGAAGPRQQRPGGQAVKPKKKPGKKW